MHQNHQTAQQTLSFPQTPTDSNAFNTPYPYPYNYDTTTTSSEAFHGLSSFSSSITTPVQLYRTIFQQQSQGNNTFYEQQQEQQFQSNEYQEHREQQFQSSDTIFPVSYGTINGQGINFVDEIGGQQPYNSYNYDINSLFPMPHENTQLILQAPPSQQQHTQQYIQPSQQQLSVLSYEQQVFETEQRCLLQFLQYGILYSTVKLTNPNIDQIEFRKITTLMIALNDQLCQARNARSSNELPLVDPVFGETCTNPYREYLRGDVVYKDDPSTFRIRVHGKNEVGGAAETSRQQYNQFCQQQQQIIYQQQQQQQRTYSSTNYINQQDLAELLHTSAVPMVGTFPQSNSTCESSSSSAIFNNNNSLLNIDNQFTTMEISPMSTNRRLSTTIVNTTDTSSSSFSSS